MTVYKDDVAPEPEEEVISTGEDNATEIEFEEIETTQKQKLNKLRSALKECEKEKMNQLEEIQRVKADFLNSRRRLEEQSKITIERSVDDCMRELIVLCDSFNIAMQDTKKWDEVDESWRKGIESIYAQLQSILKKYDVETLNPKGETFNPELHEAMGTVENSDTESDTVTEVLQLGYERKGQLIRPAKVILNK